jgi:hypothetical protein
MSLTRATPSPARKPTPAARSAAGTGQTLAGSAGRAWKALTSRPRQGTACDATIALALAVAFACGGAARAGDGSASPRLYTNQQYVEDVTAPSRLDVADMSAVLKFVLASLPDEVTVYPTENYFYFSFYDAGVRWAGNLRLDAETRDDGKIHMTYFKDFTEWQQDEKDYTKIFGAADGVKVEKLRDLVYRVTAGDRSVVFRLNDLSAVVPPEGVLLPGERYLGPVFDESGVRFFLVFKPEERLFLFVLDETVRPADEFYASSVSDKLTVGRRTGFAFYADREAPRRILVGVQAGNTGTNNYLDGPFDQLPDNFIKGNELLDAILTVSPELAGTLDRFGNSEDDTVRYLIAPYMQYEYEDELASFDGCVAAAAPATYWDCFAPGMGADSEPAEDWDEAPPPPPDGPADGPSGGG